MTIETRHSVLIRLIIVVTVGGLMVGGPVGCQRNPFNPFDANDFYVEKTDLERLRHLQGFDPVEHSQSDVVTVEAASAAMSENWTPASIAEPGEPLDLSLADVRAAALANNLDLRVALYDPAVSQASVTEEEAKFEWTFTASARRTKIDQPTASSLSSSGAEIDNVDLGVTIPLRTGGTATVNLPINRTMTNNAFSTLNPSIESDVSLSISQPLLRGAGLRPNTHSIRVAKYQKRITDTQTKLEAIRILANADRAYWRLYAAHQSLEVSQQQYELAIEQLDRAQRRFNAEVVPRLEITRAESGLAQRLEAIILAENTLLEEQRNLKVIMNREDLPMQSTTRLLIATDPNPLGLDLDGDELADFAVENRMEMLEQELQLAIDASTIDFERNQALPLVTLDYTYNFHGLAGNLGNSADLVGSGRFQDWVLGVTAEIPIGNEAAKSRVHGAIVRRIQRLATRAQREQSIRLEVYNAVDRLAADWQRVLAARQSAILATEVLRGEERQFTAGERTSTDVLDAATALADSQLSEIQALVDYQISQVDLAFATGTLLGRDQIRWEALTMDDVD